MRLRRLQVISVLLSCALLPTFASVRKEQHVTGLVGNLLRRPLPAADFTLTDQHSEPSHMAAMRGKVVLLSFIYTHCTDLCPFIALKVKDAYALLGNDASNVVFVAVTTDPKRDVPEVTAAHSRELGLFDVWHFTGGTPEVVQAVWASYGIGVTVDPATEAVAMPNESKDSNEAAIKSKAPDQGLSKSDLALVGTLTQKFGGGYARG